MYLLVVTLKLMLTLMCVSIGSGVETPGNCATTSDVRDTALEREGPLGDTR